MWTNLRAEIEAEFDRLIHCVGPIDVHAMHIHEDLTTTRATTDGSRSGPTLSVEQREARRRSLEASRRDYKASKAREYYAASRTRSNGIARAKTLRSNRRTMVRAPVAPAPDGTPEERPFGSPETLGPDETVDESMRKRGVE